MLIVVKYGGNAMPDAGGEDPVLVGIVECVRGGDAVVVVHGGGPQIDAALSARGIVTGRLDGQRVTSGEVLGVAESVLCGTVNKAIVRALLALGVAAVGLSGQDGGILQAGRLDVALGFVGKVERVEPGPIWALLAGGYVPVVAPFAYDPAARTALNVNADAAAGALAAALAADVYLNVTNVERVRLQADDPASAVASLTLGEIRHGFATDAFGGGMRPKLESAVTALAGGAKRVVIAGSGSHAIARALAGRGTEIRSM